MVTLFKDPFFNTIDKVFDDVYFNTDKRLSSQKQTNLTDTNNEYKIQLAVPGLSKDDIKITLKESTLTISYEKVETDEKTFTFTNSFKKSYNVPDDVDEKNINGSVENGVVEITLPKSKKKSIERLISLT
jgi:HSP20 family protein